MPTTLGAEILEFCAQNQRNASSESFLRALNNKQKYLWVEHALKPPPPPPPPSKERFLRSILHLEPPYAKMLATPLTQNIVT